jgi:hypothetical protein
MIVIITKKGIVAVQGGAETIRVLGTIGGQVLDDIAKVIGSIDDAQSLLDVVGVAKPLEPAWILDF